MKHLLNISLVLLVAACGSPEEGNLRDNSQAAPGEEAQGPSGVEVKLGSACASLDEDWETTPLSTVVVQGITQTLDAGSLDGVGPNFEVVEEFVTSGDSLIRKAWGRAVVLDRGANSVSLLSPQLQLDAQLTVPDCNPSDIEAINDCTAILSCYDQDALQVIDRATWTVSQTVSLTSFADDDAPGQIDQMIRIGNTTYVAMQRLDSQFAPSNTSVLVAIDNLNLTVIDTEPGVDGIQPYTLPCQKPFFNMAVYGNALAIACQGNPDDADVPPAVALFDLESKSFSILADSDTLGGTPTGITATGEGVFVAVTRNNPRCLGPKPSYPPPRPHQKSR